MIYESTHAIVLFIFSLMMLLINHETVIFIGYNFLGDSQIVATY